MTEEAPTSPSIRGRADHDGNGATRRSTGLCLSGGGYRAAAFGLGVILWLIDCGKLETVGVVSSVSGGSITNAYLARLATGREVGALAPSDFQALVRQLSSRDLLVPNRLSLDAPPDGW